MKTYRVCLTRIEHLVQWIKVEAENEDQANDKAHEQLWNGEIDFDNAEIVHAEEFVNDIEEN